MPELGKIKDCDVLSTRPNPVSRLDSLQMQG